MTVSRGPLRLLAWVCALLLVAPAAALGATDQESSFQDDDSLIFNTPEGTARTLDTLAELGVERVRVSVFWATVAPASDKRERPAFDAADPGAYPPGSWNRYDQVVRLARERGIAVNFNITSPAPLWATRADVPRADIAATYQPDAEEFSRFVQAVGTRYSGTYRPPGAATRAQDPQPPLCALLNTCPPAPPAPTGEPLPRVDYYSIWNEPNQPGWLTPQWIEGAQGGFAEAAPRIYRDLVGGAFRGLQASGHGEDTILIGETAPKGLPRRGTTTAMAALRFIRTVYCVGDDLAPLRGPAATVRGCPETDEGTAAFPDAHPGLFAATGFAHHPYSLYDAPQVRPLDPDYVTISVLSRLTRTLSRIYALYGRGTSSPPIYLTEFGYNTEPPNPAGVTLRQQASYLNRSEFIARSNPLVRTFTQFLLVDAARAGEDGVPAGYGATFQTGLKFRNGRKKPSFRAYQLPLHLPRTTVSRRARLRVWGLVRPARRIGRPQRVAIQLRARGRLRTLRRVTGSPAGIVDVRVRVPRSGDVRLAWKDPRTKRTVISRSVRVRVTR